MSELGPPFQARIDLLVPVVLGESSINKASQSCSQSPNLECLGAFRIEADPCSVPLSGVSEKMRLLSPSLRT